MRASITTEAIMREYEIIVKVGPSGHGWDSIKFYMRTGLDAARTKRDEERRKNRDAFVHIRDAVTLDAAG